MAGALSSSLWPPGETTRSAGLWGPGEGRRTNGGGDVVSKLRRAVGAYPQKCIISPHFFLCPPIFERHLNYLGFSSIIFQLQMYGSNLRILWVLLGFLGGSDGKDFVCNAGDLGSIPGSRKSPREGNGNLLQNSCLENSDRGAWWA